jgi:hypothetical protein
MFMEPTNNRIRYENTNQSCSTRKTENKSTSKIIKPTIASGGSQRTNQEITQEKIQQYLSLSDFVEVVSLIDNGSATVKSYIASKRWEHRLHDCLKTPSYDVGDPINFAKLVLIYLESGQKLNNTGNINAVNFLPNLMTKLINEDDFKLYNKLQDVVLVDALSSCDKKSIETSIRFLARLIGIIDTPNEMSFVKNHLNEIKKGLRDYFQLENNFPDHLPCFWGNFLWLCLKSGISFFDNDTRIKDLIVQRSDKKTVMRINGAEFENELKSSVDRLSIKDWREKMPRIQRHLESHPEFEETYKKFLNRQIKIAKENCVHFDLGTNHQTNEKYSLPGNLIAAESNVSPKIFKDNGENSLVKIPSKLENIEITNEVKVLFVKFLSGLTLRNLDEKSRKALWELSIYYDISKTLAEILNPMDPFLIYETKSNKF